MALTGISFKAGDDGWLVTVEAKLAPLEGPPPTDEVHLEAHAQSVAVIEKAIAGLLPPMLYRRSK
jgi:hypothetical protein